LTWRLERYQYEEFEFIPKKFKIENSGRLLHFALTILAGRICQANSVSAKLNRRFSAPNMARRAAMLFAILPVGAR